jgi:hypothetical protein
VIFLANDVPFSTNALVSGVASADSSLLPTGTNAIAAQFAAQGNYLGSTNSLQQVIAPTVPSSFTVTNAMVGGQMLLSWPAGGLLLEAPALDGPWTTNTIGATSCSITTTGAMKFFKVLVCRERVCHGSFGQHWHSLAGHREKRRRAAAVQDAGARNRRPVQTRSVLECSRPLAL